MKKKILILVCMISLIASVGVFAILHISEEVKFNKMSKFDQMVTVMDENVRNDLDFNNVLINYKYFENGLNVSDDNMDYLADLIIDGYDGEDVLRCASFWLDTSEDISIVKDMCDWKAKNPDKVDCETTLWIENAFNAVTKDKCGVLTVEDIEEYERKGITNDDIEIANRLCRKGVYTIQEILAKFESGISMVDIAIEIENIAPVTTHTDVQTMLISPNSETKHPKAEVGELFESRQLAMLKKAPTQIYYDPTDSETDIETELDEVVEMISESIIDELKSGKYLRTKGTEVEKNE